MKWVKYNDEFVLAKDDNGKARLFSDAELNALVPWEAVIPVAASIFSRLLDLFAWTPEEKAAAEERRKVRREWREYKKEQRHRRRIERIEAKAKA
jgi:hypothetical protein